MGNENSRHTEDKDQQRIQSRGLPTVNTRPKKELVSQPLPIDTRWDDIPHTPNSSSFSISDSDTEEAGPVAKIDIQSYDPSKSPLDEAFTDDPPLSQTLHQLIHFYVNGGQFVELLTGELDGACMERLSRLSKIVGFDTCDHESPYVRLVRPRETNNSEMRSLLVQQSVEACRHSFGEWGVAELDLELEKALNVHLKALVDARMGGEGKAGSNQIEFNLSEFLLPKELVVRIFEKVAREFGLISQVTSAQERIALVTGEVPKEKSIQKGELVWRRLQHWSTNVRKEKKFNIYAKGLPNEVKERILQIALEIGFETATVQQNGNIHLEIKPPEGPHRRKLKHATDELRMELEPIDDAVCQNVEQHLKEWLADFHRTGKVKDVLNCRFVLPAEWLRNTSEQLAAEHGLSVKMETGIELIFYRSDVDLAALQESASKDSGSKKEKGKGKQKKKSFDMAGKPESSLGAPSHLTDLGMQPGPPLVRRTSSRGKYDYGWDPSWPTAHPESSSTSQRTY